MRVLFTVWPLSAHLFPALPLAWALRAAGHEVCVASHPDLMPAITAAGLTGVPLGTAETMPPISAALGYVLPAEERDALAESLDVPADEQFAWDMFSVYTLASIRLFHTLTPAESATAETPEGECPGMDDLIDFTRGWNADLVLWDVAWPAGAIAARLSGAAHARLLWGLDYCAWAKDSFAAAGLDAANPLVRTLEPLAAAYGCAVDDELLYGQWTVDPTPEAVRLVTSEPVEAVRRIPHTGSGAMPSWLYPAPDRPRIAVSLGVSGRPFGARNAELIATIMAAVDGLDVEVVATLTGWELEGIDVPENVRAVDYLPLTQLLPTCAAIIHHGGGGTLTAACEARVPQLIIEGEGHEAEAYQKYLTSHGAGLVLSPGSDSVAELRDKIVRVVTGAEFASGAERLRSDWASAPAPADLVPTLELLTEKHRGAVSVSPAVGDRP